MAVEVPHSVYESAEWRSEEIADAQEPKPAKRRNPFEKAFEEIFAELDAKALAEQQVTTDYELETGADYEQAA
jgi:hypothetical protein